MQTFDASSLILAWHEYSKDLFPSLWQWVGGEFSSGTFGVSQVAFEEVKQKSQACTDFLSAYGAQPLPVTQAIVTEAMRMKSLLQIPNDDYHSKGVGENDLFIIATAYVHSAVLVSEESRQQILPDVLSKCKIPAVCNFPNVKVPCIRFIELLRQSGQSFG